LAIAVGGAWLLVVRAKRHTLAVQANCANSAIGAIVDLTVTIVVFAIADLRGRPNPSNTDPAGHALTLKMPRLAFALYGRSRRQARRIAATGRRHHAIVDDSVAVVILPVAHFGRGPHVIAHDVSAHARADALLTLADIAAAGHANPGHILVRVVNNPIAIVVNAVTDLGRGADRTDRTLHVCPLGVADVLPRALARRLVARLAQGGKIFVDETVAVVVLAVAQLLRRHHRAHAGQLAHAGYGVGLAR
jgi:hypothetical protein